MNATVDEQKPERAWGTAAVPSTVPPPTPTTQPVALAPITIPAEDNPQRTRRARHQKPERPTNGGGRRVRTFLVIVALLGAAGAGGYHVIRQRLAAAAFVDLGSVILTAEAVPVGFAEAVVVNGVAAIEHTQVSVGQELAQVTTATGRAEILRAPASGTVASVKVGVGGVAKGGEPIVMLYDQARLTFTADVAVASLRRMRLGMTAFIDGPGLAQRVTARLDHVVPVVGAGPSAGNDRLTVVLVPSEGDRGTVGMLLPGLPFNAVVDTNTASGAVPAVNTG